MYVNLLAKASTIDTSKFAHPSFVNIINNLSPDEAIFLKEIYKREAIPFITAILKESGNSYILANDLMTGIEEEIHLSFPQNTEAYLTNYEGLGLIQIRRDIYIAQEKMYKDLEQLYKQQVEELQYDREKRKLEFQKGKIDITPFGKLFMDSCLTKLK